MMCKAWADVLPRWGLGDIGEGLFGMRFSSLDEARLFDRLRALELFTACCANDFSVANGGKLYEDMVSPLLVALSDMKWAMEVWDIEAEKPPAWLLKEGEEKDGSDVLPNIIESFFPVQYAKDNHGSYLLSEEEFEGHFLFDSVETAGGSGAVLSRGCCLFCGCTSGVRVRVCCSCDIY